MSGEDFDAAMETLREAKAKGLGVWANHGPGPAWDRALPSIGPDPSGELAEKIEEAKRHASDWPIKRGGG